jgi:hypothetical protein
MRKLHLWTGILTVIIFLLTGQFMRHHQPPMTAFTPEVRLLFRSRHIYILAAGLVNLMLGLYLQRSRDWRGRAQLLGSALLLASPALLILAFTREPQRGFQTETIFSHWGLYALFAGCMLHLVSAVRQPPAPH